MGAGPGDTHMVEAFIEEAVAAAHNRASAADLGAHPVLNVEPLAHRGGTGRILRIAN